jgi:muconolactone delta-isomerase
MYRDRPLSVTAQKRGPRLASLGVVVPDSQRFEVVLTRWSRRLWVRVPPSLAADDSEVVAVRQRVEVAGRLAWRGSELAVGRLVAKGAGRVTGVVAVAVRRDNLEQCLAELVEVDSNVISSKPDKMRFVLNSLLPRSRLQACRTPSSSPTDSVNTLATHHRRWLND